MQRGGWCQFDTHPPTRSGTFETKMVNHSAKRNILTILWKEETDKNLPQPTNNLESSHFHIILAKLERCTCRRCLRAWGVKEQKDKECRKGQKKKNAVHFLPHPTFHLLCSFTPLFFCPASLAQLKRKEKMAMEASPQTNKLTGLFTAIDKSLRAFSSYESLPCLFVPILLLPVCFMRAFFLTKRN